MEDKKRGKPLVSLAGSLVQELLCETESERIPLSMYIQGLNHFCFSVSNLDKSIKFYSEVFGAKILVKGRALAYFELNGLWIALNQEEVMRDLNARTYTHIAFTINEEDFDVIKMKLKYLGVTILPGRVRDEKDKKSIYFLDPDGHMFEFHTGNLKERLDYYKAEKEHMTFYD